MRSKFKRKRHIDSCRNLARKENEFISTRGIGYKKYLVHQENFDSEDHRHQYHEHGLSIRSYKISRSGDYLNNYKERLNVGKRTRRRGRRPKLRPLDISQVIERYTMRGD